jgi:protein TonB
MSEQILFEELDRSLEALLAGAEAPACSAEVAELAAMAADLRSLPRPEFRLQLRNQLTAVPPAVISLPAEEMKVPAFAPLDANASQRTGRFALSVAAHAAAAVLVFVFITLVQQKVFDSQHTIDILESSDRILIAPQPAGGGGGGGDRSLTPASAGDLPKQSMQQLAPPTVIVRNADPRLAVPPSVVMPQTNMPSIFIGDAASQVTLASNGTGSNSGVGAGKEGGVGSGPGNGLGSNGGFGGGDIFRVGGSVSAPQPIYAPDPEYSEEARKAKYQGSVGLWVVIGRDGVPRDIRVQHSLGMGLDQKAIEAVSKWRFQPAMKDGHPVSVEMNVLVNFRLM